MPDIAAINVAVAQDSDDEDYSGQRYNRMLPKLTFGDGILTYPTYGIPLPDISNFRLKRNIKRLSIQQPPDGYEYRYDPTPRTANPVAPYGTIRIFQSNGVGSVTFPALAAHTHDLLAIRGIAATEPVVIAGGDTFGKNAATNRTIAGAAYATKGGVVPVSGGTPVGTAGGTVGPMVELGNVTVPATELRLDILGA